MDYSNIPTGLKINSQIPLDVKGYALNEATLAYLGVDDNLAFTYHEGLRVICIEERKVYEWREVGVGEENTGLVAVDFTYPSNLEEIYGINYSNRTFNFFLIETVTLQTLEDYVLQIDLPSYDVKNIGYNQSLINKIDIYDGKTTIGNDSTFNFKSISTGTGFSSSGIEITETSTIESGEIKKNIRFSLSPNYQESEFVSITGDMSYVTPLNIELKNPQKTINSFPYNLNSLDNMKTIFVTNGASNVNINLSDNLPDNFTCVLIQKGTGTITLQAVDAAIINPPSGLTNIIKGQYHWTIVEKEGSTVNFYLGGSLVTI